MISDPPTYFHDRLPAILENIKQLVEIESPSHYPAGSRQMADAVEAMFRETGAELTVERIEAKDDGEHLIVKAFPSAGPHVMLLGHTDTVHPVGTKAKNPTRIDGDRFYGCGIFDMKANIVLIAEMLRYFTETGTAPKSPITILLSCDEEVGSYTGRGHAEREATGATACYVFEPSAAGRVKTGRKGTGMYSVSARGMPAHAGLEPEKGASAILELSRQIERLHAMNSPEAGTTVNVCTAKGGTTTNVIPEFAECSVDVRFASIAEAERIDAAIRSLAPVDSRVSLTINGGINRPPLERTDAVASLFEAAREKAASFGYELGETQVGGASDGNFVAALGVPVLDGLGITGDGAHTHHEHILVSDIPERASLVTLLMADK